MRGHLPAPRLLPVTSAAIAVVLAVKCADLAGLSGAALAASGTAAALPAAARAAAAAAPPVPAAAPPVTAAAAENPASPGAISPSELALLQQLRERQKQLDSRAAALAGRERVAAAAERRLDARLDELTSLQKRLESLEAARHARDEASWQGLVRVYEVMKPRDAAVIFDDLDMPVLLQVLDRMKDRKAAPILAAMQPERARQVTTQLAELRSSENRVPDPPAAAALPARGNAPPANPQEPQ